MELTEQWGKTDIFQIFTETRTHNSMEKTDILSNNPTKLHAQQATTIGKFDRDIPEK